MTNIFAETFPESNGSAWNGRWTTQVAGTGAVVDVQSTQGRQRTGTSTYGKCGARNTTALASNDFTLMADLKIPTYTEWYAFILLRGSNVFSNTYNLQSAYQFRFNGGTWGYVDPELWEVAADGTETRLTDAGGFAFGGHEFDPLAGDTMRFKIQVSGTSTITLKYQEWNAAGSPATTTADLSSFIATPFNGAYFCLSTQGGNDTTTDDFFWDNVSIDTASTTTNKALTATGSSVASMTATKISAGSPSMIHSKFTPGTNQARNMRGW